MPKIRVYSIRINYCKQIPTQLSPVKSYKTSDIVENIILQLTIIPRARVGYEMIDSQRGA